MLSKSPTKNILEKNELTPWLKIGSGMPVTGIMPAVMPMFTNIWKVNIKVMPTASNVPKSSSALRAMVSPRQIIMPYNNNITHTPINPNSSPATANTKSVWFSG